MKLVVAVAAIVVVIAAAPAAAKPGAGITPTKEAALAVVDAWVKAQNDRDFAAYTALYGVAFVGIKRTSDGGQKQYTLDAWKADRKKMFKSAQKVAADGARVMVQGGRATVTFEQRYQSGSYADHGDKALVLAPGKSGALEIVREEMLYSAPGWKADPDAELDAKALVSPITAKVRETVADPSSLDSCAEPQDCCVEVTLTLELIDAQGKLLARDLGAATVTILHPSEVVDASTKGPMFELGEGCYEVELDYEIVHDGDALVVRRRGTGETEREDIPWQTVLTVALPAGAAIK